MKKSSNTVRITSVSFQHYKGLRRFSLSLDHVNVLTGANNSGKSTIIGAFRVLAVAMRTARSRKPERLSLNDKHYLGYLIKETQLPVSLENVSTNYEDGESKISFRLSNGNYLHLYFSSDICILVPQTGGAAISSPTTFKSNFPIELAVVPVLGPVEHREDLRERETVAVSLSTHRASRHFRNYWYHNPEGFDEFAALVIKTWPGMQLRRPERSGLSELSMFVAEERFDRELYWVGFGFQIWCQLLTHLHRASTASLVVVDEPEVYLHPDIQRRLLGVLKDSGPDMLLATHSTEIIAEADPADIVLVDKSKSSAERIKDVEGVQKAMHILGSQQNISLAALARNRRVLFVEGDYDFSLIRRFAKQRGMSDLAASLGIAAMPSGGFGSWRRISALADGIEQALGAELLIGAIYDRDYFCSDQIDEVLVKLRKSLRFAHVHVRKEIENYLLLPDVLNRVIARGLAERRLRGFTVTEPGDSAESILLDVTNDLKDEAEQQYVSRYSDYHQKHSKKDLSTLMKEATNSFRSRWNMPEGRWKLVSGKETMRRFREKIHASLGVSLTDAKVVDAMRQEDFPEDLVELLEGVELFRSLKVS